MAKFSELRKQPEAKPETFYTIGRKDGGWVLVTLHVQGSTVVSREELPANMRAIQIGKIADILESLP